MAGDARPRGAVLGAAFCASGASLVAYVASGISLTLTFVSAVALAIVIGISVWRRASPERRVVLARRVRAGIVAGLSATAAYDGSRFVLVEVLGFTFWPFDIFSIFGRALVGEHTSGWPVTAAGIGFHVLNGVGFGTAFTIWFGNRGPLAGIAWALVLEAAMLSIYPGWLDIRTLDEFVQVSVFGHVIYGTVLGLVSRHLLNRNETAVLV